MLSVQTVKDIEEQAQALWPNCKIAINARGEILIKTGFRQVESCSWPLQHSEVIELTSSERAVQHG